MKRNEGIVKNKGLIQGLYGCIFGYRVTQIKGHSGDHFNELADQLAVKASTSLKEDK